MSISLPKAYQLLDIYTRIEQNPELIFTDLFAEGVSGLNFLYQVEIDNEHCHQRCKRSAQTLPVFKSCLIRQDSFDFTVCMNFEDNDAIACLEDAILKINAYTKQFRVLTSGIEYYRLVAETELPAEPKQVTLSEFWQQFETYSMSKRVKIAFSQLFPGKECLYKPSLTRRFCSFVSMLFIKQSTIKAGYDREMKNIQKQNEWFLREFEKEYPKKVKEKLEAPEKANQMLEKQKELVDWLLQRGYTEIQGE